MDAIAAIAGANAALWGFGSLVSPRTGFPLAAAYFITLAAAGGLPEETWQPSTDAWTRCSTSPTALPTGSGGALTTCITSTCARREKSPFARA